ncbi:putative membrane protein [Hamadaea flava]|uniref:DUF1772 domain-containing protein n=1 Tax=Hamadaea flava TaxID=1742688 RepID=A0ABV8LRY4_9ACTN|nr:anthrone oxygenase family protein [Hamadaea flava]MCP2328692.1 putative membrane protein [Hamadaea flava]
MDFTTFVVILAGTLTALTGGLMFCFAVANNLALKLVDDRTYVTVVQKTNLRIVNPVFMPAFLGPVVLLPLATILAAGTDAFGWLLAASVAYIVGPFGVTVSQNIPLNKRLDAVDVRTASDADLATARGWFEQPWIARHTVRTVLGVVAIVLVLIGATRL